MNDTAPPTAPRAVDDDAPVPPGRPMRLVPTPPGLWRVLIGVVVALLAPFFGILIGSGIGAAEGGNRMDPLYWGFFIGGLIGALGLVAAGIGAMALIRHARAQQRVEDAERADDGVVSTTGTEAGSAAAAEAEAH
ncbi:hypothetical protein [Brachybacterium epidermidis]|uniref:hypothetical protein n=1 Tax=Brachybacterium epidermidis TaxID=2781983 RepID=UPI00398E4D12